MAGRRRGPVSRPSRKSFGSPKRNPSRPMPVFTYRAADRGGKTVDGVMQASDVRVVAGRLHRDAYFPLGTVSQTERAPWWLLGVGGCLRQAGLLAFPHHPASYFEA